MNKFLNLLLFLVMITASSCLGLIDEQKEELGGSSEQIVDDGGGGDDQKFSIPQPILDLREMSFQTIPHNLYEYNTSLPDPYVRDMVTDSKGNIYIATNAGLAISPDNGQNFYVKTTVHGLPTNVINSLFVDNNDVLYLATHGGGLTISRDGGNTFEFNILATGLPNRFLRAVYVDNLGTIYVAPYDPENGSGLGYCYSSNGGDDYFFKTRLNTTFGLVNNNVKGFFKNPITGSLFIARDNGIDITSNHISFSHLNLPSINNVFGDTVGNVFATSNNYGLAHITPEGMYLKNMLNNDLASDQTFDFIVNSQGHYIVSTSNGISISTDEGLNFTTLNKTTSNLPTNVITKILLKGDALLAGSAEGFSYASSKDENFRTTGVTHGLKSNNFTKARVDKDGNIFAISPGRGVFISRDDGRTFFESTQGLPSLNINDIFVDRTGVLYVATDAGLAISNNFGEQYMTKYSINGLPSNNVNCVYVNADGHIFAGTDNGIAISTDHYGLSFTAPLTGVNILSIYDWDGYLLIGTENYGLLISPDHGDNYYQRMLNGNPSLVRDIEVNIYGHVYLATNNGLYVSEDGTISFKRYNDTDLPAILSLDVFEVETDARGIAYVVSSRGVNTILPIPDPFDYEIERKLTNFGISALKVNSVSIDRNGRAWFATEGGLSRTVGLDL